MARPPVMNLQQLTFKQSRNAIRRGFSEGIMIVFLCSRISRLQ